MHKIIGIIGGMSPESTTIYYEYITRTYTQRFGDFGYPKVIIYSMSFQKLIDHMVNGQWDDIAVELIAAARSLHQAGADFAIIATNTMHKMFDQIQSESPIPLHSIIDATAEKINNQKIKTIGLLGTRFTMVQDFFKDGLKKQGIETIVPDQPDILKLNEIIFTELIKGEIREVSKNIFMNVVADLKQKGAEGIIMGCTEIPLIICEKDSDLPLFDTTNIHAAKALSVALGE